MKTFKTRGQHKVLVTMLVMFVIVSLVPSASLAELIILRSGQVNGAPGTIPSDPNKTFDDDITCLVGSGSSPLRGSSFTAADFDDACNGNSAELIVPHPPTNWIETLACDPNPRWINYNHDMSFVSIVGSGYPSASVLYCHPFMVDTAEILCASIDFCWAADDTLGDPNGGGPNPIGVYINGTALSVDFRGGSSRFESNATQCGIEGLLIPGVMNTLYVYQRDVGGSVSGVIYSAAINIITPVEVVVDIKPTSCPNPLNVQDPNNVNDTSLVPVAILGTEDFDVTTIDIASIRLEGVAPWRYSFEDVATPVSDSNDCNCTTDGPDGFLDLTLKFKTKEIVEAVGAVNDGDVQVLTLTGVLLGPMLCETHICETPIEGADCMVIRGRHKPINRADHNKDGVVDFRDFAIFAENWLQSSIVED